MWVLNIESVQARAGISLTRKEARVLAVFILHLPNKRDTSEVTIYGLAKCCRMGIAISRGVVGSLTKKGILEHRGDFKNGYQIIYLTNQFNFLRWTQTKKD